MKRILIALTAVGLVLAAANLVSAVTPKNGVYQGTIDGSPDTNGHNEGEGYFRVKLTSIGDKKIASPGTFACGGGTCMINFIVAPTYAGCNVLNANLEASKIPVTAGAFDYTGGANIGATGARVHIHFKGSWVSQTRVKGFTRTWTSTCDSGKQKWTMDTPPP